ncbi:MAG TPA: PadR family transcriptional regulator [Gemmatimonadaceae bacterium]|nr:PadR family transcriptional regulator [Gemmatimonadaceae bacterium]
MAVNTTLDFALLGLLADGQASGYALRRVFQTTPLGRYSDSPGSIYPALHRLERQGLVAGRTARGGRRQRVLHLTAAGRRALTQWATAPLTLADSEGKDSELALRLALMSSIAPRHLRRFLREYAEVLEERARLFGAAVREMAPKLSASNRLAVDLGLFEMKSRARWCRARLAKAGRR